MTIKYLFRSQNGSGDTDATPGVVLVAAKISDGTNTLSSDQPVFNGASNAAPPAINAVKHWIAIKMDR